MMRSIRSSWPWSNSWLPTADAPTPAALRKSMVYPSLVIAEMNAEPPTLSPEVVKTFSSPLIWLLRPVSSAAPVSRL